MDGDHAFTRINLRGILASHGIDVCGEACDAKEAVQKVEELRPHVVILDVFMLAVSGFVAAQLIKEVCPTTKIIFMSLHLSAKKDSAVTRLLGGNEFVPKTDAVRELVPVIKRLAAEA